MVRDAVARALVWTFPAQGFQSQQGYLAIRNSAPLGPYSGTKPSVLWKSWGRELFLMSEVPLYPAHLMRNSGGVDVRLSAFLLSSPAIFNLGEHTHP